MPPNRVRKFFSGSRNGSRPITFGEINWRDTGSIVAFAQHRWETRNQRRGHYEQQWYVNVANYLGHQYMEWNGHTQTLHTPEAPPWRVRLVANLVQGVSRKVVSRIMRAKPTWNVVPATGEVEDIMASRVSERVLRYYWDGPLEMDEKLLEAVIWMSCTGNSFIKGIWNPRAGSEFSVSEDEVDDEKAKKTLRSRKATGKGNKMATGEFESHVLSPFQGDPDDAATCMRGCRFFIEDSAVPVDELVEQFGREAHGIEPDLNEDNTRHFESRIADLSAPGQLFARGNTNKKDRHDGMVRKQEIWTRRVKGHPKGLVAVVAGGRLLGGLNENTYSFQGKPELPYCHLQEIQVPGRFWATCALEQALGLQAEYNRGRSQLIEARNLMSKPKWLVPAGANLISTALTSMPGEKVTHTPGLRPEAWVPPPMPPYVVRLIDMARQDIQDVTQIHDVSQGKAPGQGVRSGVAIATLQEQDETVLSPTVLQIGKCLEKFASMMLAKIADKVTEPRLIKIVGDNNMFEAQTFLGKDLTGNSEGPNVNYFDVRVQMGSQLPLTKEARLNFISQLANLGLVDTEEGKAKLLEMLDIGSVEPLFDESRLDISNARQENVLLRQGQLVEINDSDNDIAHMDVHILEMKMPEYRDNATPESDEAFRRHVTAHNLRAQGKANPQAEQQQQEQIALADAQAQQLLQQQQQAALEASAPVPQDPQQQLIQLAAAQELERLGVPVA